MHCRSVDVNLRAEELSLLAEEAVVWVITVLYTIMICLAGMCDGLLDDSDC